jgi:hypothetical protein
MAGLAFAHQNLSCLNGDLYRCCCHLLELALVALCEERNLSQMIEPCVACHGPKHREKPGSLLVHSATDPS